MYFCRKKDTPKEQFHSLKGMDSSRNDTDARCGSSTNVSESSRLDGVLLFKSKVGKQQEVERPWIGCVNIKHIVSFLAIIALLFLANLFTRTGLKRYDLDLLLVQRTLDKSLNRGAAVNEGCQRPYHFQKLSDLIHKAGILRATSVELEHCSTMSTTRKREEKLAKQRGNSIDRSMDFEPKWDAFLQKYVVHSEKNEPPQQRRSPVSTRKLSPEHNPPANRFQKEQAEGKESGTRRTESQGGNRGTDGLLKLLLSDKETRPDELQGRNGLSMKSSGNVTQLGNRTAPFGDHPDDNQIPFSHEQRILKGTLGSEEFSTKQNPGVQRCESKLDCSPRKLCVEQVCVCPVLYSSRAGESSEEECTKPASSFKAGCISPISVRDLNLLASHRNLSLLPSPKTSAAAALTDDPLRLTVLPPQQQQQQQQQQKNETKFQELADFSTCAVVGSSSSLISEGSKFGGGIDKHSAVIRFNDAPTAGLEEWVGSKTTLRIQNVIYCGFTESPGELCMRYTSKQRGDHIELQSRCKKGWGKCTVIQQSQHLILYAMAYMHLAGLHQVQHNASLQETKPLGKMSAGFFGIALALHICGQVDVYGIEGGEMHYYVKGRNMHNPKEPCTKAGCPSKRSFAQRHNWTKEALCLSSLREAQNPRLSFHGT